VTFANGSNVVAAEKRHKQTPCVTNQGKTAVRVVDTLDKITRTEVCGIIQSLPEIGSWKAPVSAAESN